MNGTSKELVGVLKDSTSISSIYQGEKLVWGKNSIGFNFSGKFTDNSNNEDYFYYSNEFGGKTVRINVDETTKAFQCNVSDIPYLTLNTKIKEITAFPDITNETTLYLIFSHCEGLSYINVDCFNTENVTNMATMFSNCYALTELDLSSWVTSKVTILQGMFTYCIELTNLKLNGWDISGVRVLSSLFSDCYKLETLNINGWDFSNVMSFSSTFARCNSLSNVIGTICGIKSSIDLTAAPLTNDSAMVFINGLATVSASRTITFKKSTYDTLTDGQKSIATSKGWTIASK